MMNVIRHSLNEATEFLQEKWQDLQQSIVAPADEQNRLWTLPGKNSFISNT